MKRTYKILHTLFAVIIAISCISCSNKRVDILSTIPEGFAPMYMCGNVKEVRTYKYKYDRKGNWIEQVANCGSETRITKREIIYY